MGEDSRYGDVNDRLKEIVDMVSDDTLPLDDALDLFEEAVKLGMEASTLMEEDMAARDAEQEAQEAQALADEQVLSGGPEDGPGQDAPDNAALAVDTSPVDKAAVEGTPDADMRFPGASDSVLENAETQL